MNEIAATLWTTVIPASPVFTTARVAEAAGVHPNVATRALSALAAQGVIEHLASGVWGDVRHPDFSPYAIVPPLAARVAPDQPAYVSLLSALHLHGMIEQIPQTIHVVLPVQRRGRHTGVGQVEFFQLEPDLIGGYEPCGRAGNFDLATPTKALFDTLYLSIHRGRRFTHFPELILGPRFRRKEMAEWLTRIRSPRKRSAVASRWARLQVKIGQFDPKDAG